MNCNKGKKNIQNHGIFIKKSHLTDFSDTNSESLLFIVIYLHLV